MTYPIIPRTHLLGDCSAYGHSPCCCSGQTSFTKEMCHEEIPHRDRVDLPAHRPGSRECALYGDALNPRRDGARYRDDGALSHGASRRLGGAGDAKIITLAAL
jgi:hypothetical protein